VVRLEKLLLHKSHIIWDWNGTLLNDGDLCAAITEEMMVAHGLTPISREEHRRRFRLPVETFYKDLGFDFSRIEFKQLAEEFVNKYRERFHLCRLFDKTPELLASLQAQGKRQAVLSASREKELHYLVDHFGLGGYFDHVFGLGHAHATGKVDLGYELLVKWGVSKESCVLVGDMDHDVEVARALGIEILLVDHGHQDVRHWLGSTPLDVHRRSE